jgi:hypothetical protein
MVNGVRDKFLNVEYERSLIADAKVDCSKAQPNADVNKKPHKRQCLIATVGEKVANQQVVALLEEGS